MQRVQLPASQATYIASGTPDANFGGSSVLNLGWRSLGSNAMRMLVQFDLGPLPANAQITSARFFINQSLITPPNENRAMTFPRAVHAAELECQFRHLEQRQLFGRRGAPVG